MLKFSFRKLDFVFSSHTVSRIGSSTNHQTSVDDSMTQTVFLLSSRAPWS